MSEHVHVHAPHDLSESDDRSTARGERIIELIATFLLAFATLGIAWSGYEAARWNGRQAERYAAANTARSLANRAATNGDRQRTQDQLNFNRWLEVKTENNQPLADLYERRIRFDFGPAFDAWLAQDPLNNPTAEPSPLRMPQSHVAELDKSDRLERKGDERFELAKDATENTDSYVLTTVFFAAVLFFAGISIRFRWLAMRITVLVLASVSLVYAIVLVARLPTV